MLSDLFIPALPEKRRVETSPGNELEETLVAIVREARRAHPGVEVSNDVYLPYLAARVADDRPIVKSIRRMVTADLYLACGCAHGDKGAINRFDEILSREVDSALSQLQIPGADLSDIKQQLRHRLLVGDERPYPRITEYVGRGDLRAWVKVVAVRDALQIRRKLKREVVVEHAEMPLLDSDDPELREIKKMYQADFKLAFQEALRALGARERNLLRHHFLHGLNIDEIGALYGVHRATVARWIARTRQDLLAATRAGLMERLRASDEDIESIMALVQSNLDVSISRFLKTTTRADDT